MDDKSINDIFKEYSDIKEQIAILEEKKLELEAQVQEALDTEGVTNQLTIYGHFYSMSRKSWDYSDNVKQMQEDVKKKKKLEELNGTATLKKVSSYVMLDKKEKLEIK